MYLLELEIICIKGGPNCNEEQAQIPSLEKAISNDILNIIGKEVDVSFAGGSACADSSGSLVL